MDFFRRGFKRAFLVKPLDVFAKEESDHAHSLHRVMSLFDLLCVGVGGTIGTGIFVLTGLIAKDFAGPSAMFSFLIGGFACLLSAASYGELSSRISSAGSSYAYAYAVLGEYPAVIAAFAVSLEYGISGAAISRSWGDKLNSWIKTFGYDMHSSLDDYGINLFAGALQLACALILLAGVQAGKVTVNFFTLLKVFLCFFMIIGGLLLFQPNNLIPMAPFGVSGILRGSTTSFFALLGFDEVCCMAGETKDPHNTLPKAVFGTIFIVSVLYFLAALALVGMVPYPSISAEACFAEGFRSRGLSWAAQVVSIGEIVCLPLVALISFLAQPRIQYAMAKDNLLPEVFARMDSRGNLSQGIIISGIVCTIIAIFVPFSYLNDVISAGVLFSFNLTNSSLIIMRRGDVVQSHSSGYRDRDRMSYGGGSTASRRFSCSTFLYIFHVLAILFSVCFVYLMSKSKLSGLDILILILFIMCCCALAATTWAISKFPENNDPLKESQYRVPFVPYLPLSGILVNYFLIAQLSRLGLLLLLSYFGIATLHYCLYCLNQKESASYRVVYEKCDSDVDVDIKALSSESDNIPLVVSKFRNHGTDGL